MAEKSVPERVFFHLVENRKGEYPFAFLATYATKDENGSVRHVPLKYALTEYRDRRDRLLALLSCLNRAAEVSDLIAGFMEKGELFHPLGLTAEEAYTFLRQIEEIEQTGILCRIPDWWKKKTAAVSLSVTLGEKKESMLGFNTLVSVQPRLMVDGVPLTREDVRRLLAQTEGLAFLKGKWVEVDHERLRKLLEEMEDGSGEITEYLAQYLKGIFHTDGYVLHGGTPVARRGKIVEEFQSDRYVPFIVLSVKAGGTGLNLTKANHVIHFDRWWNPAVENQATDRAFRIGQTKDVMVHKLVSKGTIEEKIDEMINAKKELAENVIGSGGESWITELDNEALMQLLRLE